MNLRDLYVLSQCWRRGLVMSRALKGPRWSVESEAAHSKSQMEKSTDDPLIPRVGGRDVTEKIERERTLG